MKPYQGTCKRCSAQFTAPRHRYFCTIECGRKNLSELRQKGIVKMPVRCVKNQHTSGFDDRGSEFELILINSFNRACDKWLRARGCAPVAYNRSFHRKDIDSEHAIS